MLSSRVRSLLLCCFKYLFLQEKDGIRVLVQSRRLGDVYREQSQLRVNGLAVVVTGAVKLVIQVWWEARGHLRLF